MGIVEVIHSLKENIKAFQDLEISATKQWGKLYWLDSDFQDSKIATIMEKTNAEINYYSHQFNSSIHLN